LSSASKLFLIVIIKQQLKQKYEELFFDELKPTKENSKIYIYSKIKTEHEMNNYILNINYEDRKLLCKMHVSHHFLEFERGRTNGTVNA
jgi:hypothetical protein